MSTRRTAKVAEAIRQVVSAAILFQLRDPRVKNVTILGVEVPEDLRTAKIKISIMGDEKAEKLTLKGLNSAKGWLQSKIADELKLRYTPLVTFAVDHGIQNAQRVSEILQQLELERHGEQGRPADHSPDEEDDDQEFEDEEFDEDELLDGSGPDSDIE